MENKAEISKMNGGKVAVIGAIITAVAGIITAIVSISGPLIDKQMAIKATQTREAVLMGAMQVGGAAIQRTETATPGIPAANDPVQQVKPVTAAPTLILSANDTQPAAAQKAPEPASGSMLKVGESATSNGIKVTLTQVEFPAANEVHLHFTFTNTTKKVVKITLDHNRDVVLTDDKGTPFRWATAFSWEVSIYPGTSRNDEIKRRGDVSKADTFIIKLDVPGLLSAQWEN